MRYPAWWNKTITVYNRYEDPSSGMITWYKTAITNVFVKTVKNRIVSADTEEFPQDNIVRIPKSGKYLDPQAWEAQRAQSDGFTLRCGDIIVMGEVTDEIDEYTKGKRSNDLIAKYVNCPGCFAIQSLSVNDFGGLAHYLVRG